MKNLVKPKPTVQERFQDFLLRTCYVIELTYCFFVQMIIFVTLHIVQCLGNAPFVLIYTPNRSVSCPAHILHSAFTD